MKDLLSHIKTTLQNNTSSGNTLSYVQSGNIEITEANQLKPLNRGELPYIGIAHVNMKEEWVSNAQRQKKFIVDIYVVTEYKINELSIIGSGSQKGILDIVEDIIGLLRNERFTSYLTTPFQLESTAPIGSVGDNIHLLVHYIQFTGEKIFLSSVS